MIRKEYGVFDWKDYIISNKDLKHIKSNIQALKHFKETGINEARILYFINNINKTFEWFNLQKYLNIKNINYKISKTTAWKLWIKDLEKDDIVFDNIKQNNLDVSFHDFDWINYLKINDDLYKSGINIKELAWDHWSKFGIKEERAYSFINNSYIHNGRFGNLFFINMFMNFYSIKFNLLCSYKYYKKFDLLGIELNVGTNTYDRNFYVTEQNYLMFLNNEITHKFKPSNIIIHNNIWFQNKDFCLYLQNYFYSEHNKNKIIAKNNFKERYINNNDLFIHLRLGDVESTTTELFGYYEKLLSTITFTKGYISSDSITNIFCEYLIKKYNLTIINYDEINTIMFASTCNNIVLSGGTFSWMMGFFAFYAKNIYYPKYNKPWFGNIFETNSSWICFTPLEQ
jgi:hypothetical protein